MQQDVSRIDLDELKEKIMDLLNESMHIEAAKAYQNCINLIDDLQAELELAAQKTS